MLLLSGAIDKIFELSGPFKEVGSLIAGVGFVCAGLGVIKKAITNHERLKEAIITYIIALVVFLLIWSMI